MIMKKIIVKMSREFICEGLESFLFEYQWAKNSKKKIKNDRTKDLL